MLNQQTKEYLQAPAGRRRGVLKKQYLARVPGGASEQDRARFHLGSLVEFTGRLNIIECKSGNQPVIKPSMLRTNDLFVCVELCAESIQENAFLQTDEEFRPCWVAFIELLERVKSKDGSELLFETAYLLLYLAAVIFKRHITDAAIEMEPQIFSIKGYTALANEFAPPLFGAVKSPADQLKNLADNLRRLARS